MKTQQQSANNLSTYKKAMLWLAKHEENLHTKVVPYFGLIGIGIIYVCFVDNSSLDTVVTIQMFLAGVLLLLMPVTGFAVSSHFLLGSGLFSYGVRKAAFRWFGFMVYISLLLVLTAVRFEQLRDLHTP